MFSSWAENERISLKYPVSKLSFQYGQPHPSLPNLEGLRNASVKLSVDDEEILLAPLIRGATAVLKLDDQDLYKLAELPIRLLKDNGFEGVLAFPNPKMIDPVSGQDIRKDGDNSLEIVIWSSMLEEVVVQRERLASARASVWKIKSPVLWNRKICVVNRFARDLLNIFRVWLNIHQEIRGWSSLRGDEPGKSESSCASKR